MSRISRGKPKKDPIFRLGVVFAAGVGIATRSFKKQGPSSFCFWTPPKNTEFVKL